MKHNQISVIDSALKLSRKARLNRMKQLSSTPEPRLCELCQELDVRLLILESEKDGVGKHVTPWEMLTKENVRRFPRLFFKHHSKLSDLKDTSRTCDFCGLIWQTFRSSAENSRIPDDDINTDVGGGQIYVACTPIDAAWHRLPQVVVFQHGDNKVMRTLAWLDMYAHRGRCNCQLQYLID